MEASALTYPHAAGRHTRSPLLRLQSDEHLIRLIRAGHDSAFEVLLSRYESRLLSFCRHLLGSREDAEDVLQEVFAAAYHAIGADDRPINVRPWLYRIARNRSLNHLRRVQAIGVDSMDVLFAAHGETTADRVHQREEFRLLVDDIHGLPESQRTALILRELDALSYDQIAETMETTVSSVKSLLVRARVSLAETAEARLLTCGEVRTELAEIAEGLSERANPLVRRHLKSCDRCRTFNKQLRRTNRALAALLPIGPVAIWKAGLLSHLSTGAGTGAAATGSTAAGTSSGVAGGGVAGAMAAKATVGLALAVFVTAAGISSSGAGHPFPALQGGTASQAAIGWAARSSAAQVRESHPVPARHVAATDRRGRAIRAHLTASATHSRTLAPLHTPSSQINSSASLSGPGAASQAPVGSTTPVSQGTVAASATTPVPTPASGTSNGTSPVSGAGGTAGAGSGSLSSVAGTVGTVAASVGAGLGGSGTGGSGQSTGTPTITLPSVLAPIS